MQGSRKVASLVCVTGLFLPLLGMNPPPSFGVEQGGVDLSSATASDVVALSADAPEKSPSNDVCPSGYSKCPGKIKCFDLKNHSDHCGKCGAACPDHTKCVDSVCRPPPQNDRHNCGSWGNSCRTEEACCGSKCVELDKSDNDNCGACGKKCGAGTACAGNRCVATVNDKNHCGGLNKSCWESETCCGDACKNVKNDPQNCGRCGQVCNGTCKEGVCYDLDHDPNNCGTIGSKISAGAMCCHGRDTKIASDDLNCGACGHTCSSSATRSAGRGLVCKRSTCVCPGNATKCGSGNDTFCAELSGDDGNCGACGNACANNKVCVRSKCQPCSARGLATCGGQCSNLQSDSDNCGKCGATCPSSRECVQGRCMLK